MEEKDTMVITSLDLEYLIVTPDFCIWFIKKYKVKGENLEKCFSFTIREDKFLCTEALYELISKKKYNVEIHPYDVENYLEHAISNKNLKTIKWLLKTFESPNDYYLLFWYACTQKDTLEIAKYLASEFEIGKDFLKYDLTCNYRGRKFPLLFEVAENGDLEKCKWLIEYFELDVKDVINPTLLEAFGIKSSSEV